MRTGILVGTLLLLLTSGNAMSQISPANRLPELVAHRGASWLAPENTLASVNLAWEIGADAVEIDIYLSADNQIVLFHDATTRRTAGQDGRVEEMTFDELRQLDVGLWKGAQWQGERIATLEQALATVPPGKRIFVETKTDERIVEPMLEVFDRSGLHPWQIVVITFSWETAEKTKRLRPHTPVYWLSGFRQDPESGAWSPTMEELVEKAQEANLDGLNLRFIGPATEDVEVARIRDAGLGYYIWTVNDLDDAQRALQLGVDGITTDRPAWMKKQLLARNGWKLLNNKAANR